MMAASTAVLLLALVLLTVDSVLCQRPGNRKPGGSRTPAAPSPRTTQAPQDSDDLTDECPEPNGYFADGYQCDKYYECIDGAITEKLCPDGMVFNDYNIQVEKCDLPFNIDCSTRSELQKPKPSTHCPRQNGYFAHEDGSICDKFYFCVDGKYNMIVCPDGLVYNERTGICTWPDEAKKAGCSSQGAGEKGVNMTESQPKNQTWQLMTRGKRYTVHENQESEEDSRDEENFQFKDQAELEKITEEGYGKDYEDGLWEDPNAAPSTEAASEIPDDYDSADYEDKRREEDSGSAEYPERSAEANSADYEDSVENSSGQRGRYSTGSIFGEKMLLDEDGFPIFDHSTEDDADLRRWSKRDTILSEGPLYGGSKDYEGYSENEAMKTSAPQPVLTTTSLPASTIITRKAATASTAATASPRAYSFTTHMAPANSTLASGKTGKRPT